MTPINEGAAGTEPYWVTVQVHATSDEAASAIARELVSRAPGGRVIQVEPEPPQGSTIVGDMHEDAL